LRIERRIGEIQRLWPASHPADRPAGCAQLDNLVYQPLLLLPPGFLLGRFFTASLLGRLQLGQALCVVTKTYQALALQLADLSSRMAQRFAGGWLRAAAW
jgi:hypothetical protein